MLNYTVFKTIIFDYGGVLGSDANEWETTFRKIPQVAELSSQKIQNIFEKHWLKLKLGKEPIKTSGLKLHHFPKIKLIGKT